ncbi:hypothetical protein, partial [Streptomyces sp. 058-1L]|uniref:hypothetical protein n=1 Tax=Streptomyces sp. 058-1L TaxID=2789266 RepID=UPI003980EE71
MIDESPMYRMILEMWNDAAPFGQTNWWEFHLFQSDLGLYAPFLAEFTAQRPDLHVRPDETDPQEYRQFVVEQYVEWLAREGIDQSGWSGQQLDQQYPQSDQSGWSGQQLDQQYPQSDQSGWSGQQLDQQYPQSDQSGWSGQ